MPWTKVPPLTDGWSPAAELSFGQVRYNSFSINTLTYEDADLLQYSSAEGWGMIGPIEPEDQPWA